jgi:hypothetical protein
MMKKSPLLFVLMLMTSFASAQAIGDYRSNNAATFNWDADASWQRWNGAAWVAPTGAQGYPGETAASIAGTVTIQNGHTVTANTDVTTNDLGNLILQGSGRINFNSNIDIDVTGALTMDGTSQITGSGTSRTLDVGSLVIPATATNARITQIQLRVLINDANDVTKNGSATINGLLNMSSTTSTVNGATAVNLGGTLTLSSDTGVKTFTGRVTVAGTWTSTSITTNNNLVFGGEVVTSGTFNCGCN